MRHTVVTDLYLHPIFCRFLVSEGSVNSSLCPVKPRKKNLMEKTRVGLLLETLVLGTTAWPDDRICVSVRGERSLSFEIRQFELCCSNSISSLE